MSLYRTITGREIDTRDLPRHGKEVLHAVLKEYKSGPDWGEFSGFWQTALESILSAVPRDERPRHPLYRIAQDLEMRLGIAQGVVAEPDYRDYIADRIEEKYGSRYRFCKETGIPEAFLSQVLSGKKDFSVDTLRRAAKALGLGLALVPVETIAALPVGDIAALT